MENQIKRFEPQNVRNEVVKANGSNAKFKICKATARLQRERIFRNRKKWQISKELTKCLQLGLQKL